MNWNWSCILVEQRRKPVNHDTVQAKPGISNAIQRFYCLGQWQDYIKTIHITSTVTLYCWMRQNVVYASLLKLRSNACLCFHDQRVSQAKHLQFPSLTLWHYIPPTHRWTLTRLHSVFAVNSVTTLNPFAYLILHKCIYSVNPGWDKFWIILNIKN